jgi:transcriptional regulator with XRE-family HTH domain
MDAIEFRLFRAIAKNIQYVRESKRLTQDEFAEQCGISRNQLIRAESGRGEIRIQTLTKIAVKNGLKITELLVEQGRAWVDILPGQLVHKKSPKKIDETELRFSGTSTWRGKVLKIPSRTTLRLQGEVGVTWFINVTEGVLSIYSPVDSLALSAGMSSLVKGNGEFRLVNPHQALATVLIVKVYGK